MRVAAAVALAALLAGCAHPAPRDGAVKAFARYCDPNGGELDCGALGGAVVCVHPDEACRITGQDGWVTIGGLRRGPVIVTAHSERDQQTMAARTNATLAPAAGFGPQGTVFFSFGDRPEASPPA